jgi:DnaJ-domain-containing protein 1
MRPTDPGVAVYFRWDDDDRCFAIDRYTTVEANIQAMHHIIEAERVKLRHGGLTFVRASMATFAGLPPPGKVASNAVEDPWTVLGVKQNDPPDVIKAAYRRIVQKVHPDSQTPNAERWHAAVDAYNTIMRSRKS